ncbi:MAG: APC family permease, partial [Oscillospiraceae bacterium]|nr:APC family permease [Oscillospiraceae bacterium]
MDNTQGSSRLIRKLSPLAVWALAFGCSVGWGSFVMPGTTFLPIAGPLGTVLGIAVGTAVMMLIGVNYTYLMNRHPDAGGTFTYSKRLFGTDHGFLSAWFMGLVYLAIIWANATAIPLIFRNIFGDLLQFGKLYSIAGYDVYVGEVLISLAAELVFLPLCLRGCRTTGLVQTVLAFLLLGGVLFGFAAAFLGPQTGGVVPDLQPLYSPDHKPGLGILLIVFLAPWAFAGFESVSHSVEEFKFSPKKGLRILLIALVSAAAAYILLALLGASAQPEGAKNWYEYLQHLGEYSRVEGLPTFYGVYRAAGGVGLAVLGVAAAAAIITGLVGNATAASRLIYAMARDDMLPQPLAKLNRHGAPKNAILLLLLVSLPIPFLGRSAIGWIVDVNTIGATIAYGYTSAAAFVNARRSGRRGVQVT